MTDTGTPTTATPATDTAAAPVTVAVVIDEVTAKLQSLGVAPDTIVKIKDLGADTVNDLLNLTEADLLGAGVKPLKARSLLAALAPASAAVAASVTADPNAEIPEGGRPSPAQVTNFAAAVGMDGGLLQTVMLGGLLQGGALGDMDLTTMMPIPNIVSGYSPKRRDISYLIMGQLEARFGVPIVVINNDGSVNHELTTRYVMSLDEGFDAAEDDIYYDDNGTPYDVKAVGVDAQSIYDADPLILGKALQQNGMGQGRVTWSGVTLDVRQVAYYAANQTGEINPTSEADMQWLRDNIKAGMSRLVLKGKAPKAIGLYNEAARAGSLPSLRVMLDRKPRRREVMPRRRRINNSTDLTGIGGNALRDEERRGIV